MQYVQKESQPSWILRRARERPTSKGAAVLKSRRLGYDGKGQVVIHDPLLALDAWRAIGEVPAILEPFISFDRELSILSVRGRDGSTGFSPLYRQRIVDVGLHRRRLGARKLAPALPQRKACFRPSELGRGKARGKPPHSQGASRQRHFRGLCQSPVKLFLHRPAACLLEKTYSRRGLCDAE